MKSCAFCAELNVESTRSRSTSSTPSSETFPFLCTQLDFLSGGNPSALLNLCRNCNSLYEEVTILYTNMQGLVSLMGRRVGQIRETRKGKRTRSTNRNPPPESVMNWWYPSTSTETKRVRNSLPDGNDLSRLVFEDGEEEIVPEVKTEPFDVDLDSENEDFEIRPEASDDNEESEWSGGDDPSYDPLHIDKNKSQSKSRRRWRVENSCTKRQRLENDSRSDSENEATNKEGGDPLISKRIRYDWNKVAEFETSDEAETYLRKLNQFTLKVRHTTSEGLRLYYNCRYLRQCQCPGKAKIEVEEGENRAQLYFTTAEHSHGEVKDWGLSRETKMIVLALYQSGTRKPKRIFKALQKDERVCHKLPTRIQLNNFLGKMRNSKATQRSFGLSEEDVKAIKSRYKKDMTMQKKSKPNSDDEGSTSDNSEEDDTNGNDVIDCNEVLDTSTLMPVDIMPNSQHFAGANETNLSADSSQTQNEGPSADHSVPQPVKRQKVQHDWEKVAEFSTLDEAKDYLKGLNQYTYHVKRIGSDVTKLCYNCKRSIRCPSKFIIEIPVNGSQIELYKTSAQHLHEGPIKDRGLAQETKVRITQLHDIGISTPKQILETIKNEGAVKLPTKNQLCNFLHQLRHDSDTRKSLGLGLSEGEVGVQVQDVLLGPVID